MDIATVKKSHGYFQKSMEWKMGFDCLLSFFLFHKESPILTLEAENKKLREALGKYGKHILGCEFPAIKCQCGLLQALGK